MARPLLSSVRSVHLRGHTPASLAADWPLALPLARRVIERLVGEDKDDLDGVRGLPRALARDLLARASTTRLALVDRRESPSDGFVKYLFRAEDGATLETVRIPLEKPRWSICVSSQAGCGLGCTFCATGRLGFSRHLEAWEIVEQVLAVRRVSPQRPVSGVVFQGQGEPLQNYDAVMRAAAILRDPNGLRIRGESITISTVGLVPAIDRYADERHVHRLILSLTSAIPERRDVLVPSARAHPLPELARAAARVADVAGGPVHLGWVLLRGINTGADEADAIARLFPHHAVRVHLIDVNDSSGRFVAPDDAERGRFVEALGARGIAFVRRYSGGAAIEAACGMLASTARGGLGA